MSNIRTSVPYMVEITMGEKTWTVEGELPVLLHEESKDDEPLAALDPREIITYKIADEMERHAVKIARANADKKQ